MPVPEPRQSSLSPAAVAAQKGGFNGRWRWWYSNIADYRLTHPGCKNVEIAQHLNKHENTISQIIKTDLYREYEAQRREEWRRDAENELTSKLIGVTSLALDSMKVNLEKKRDQVPLEVSRSIVATGLESLGFGPKPQPSVVVNNTNQQVVLPNSVSATALEEARMALRTVEQQRLAPRGVVELEAEPLKTLEDQPESKAETGEVRAPSTDS